VNLGLAHYQKGDYRGAREPLEKALALDGHLGPALGLLGLSRAALGERAAAKPLLEKAFQTTNPPLDAELRRLVGIQLSKAYSLDRQPEQAEALFATLVREYPRDVEVLYHAFWLHLTHGRDVLNTLVRTAPNNWRTYQILGYLLADRENYAAAAEQFRLALRENPDGLGLHYSLGNSLAPLAKTAEDRSKAREQFEAELKLNPRHAPSYHQLAELALLDGHSQQARELFEQAARIDPGYASAHVGICRVLAAEQQPSEALPHCETAVRLDPELRDARYRLARLYQQLGRDQDARREMAVFRKLDEESHRESQYLLGAKMGVPTQ
jgi:tetratricopeptide (TPR) repeat protein